jgi:FdhD protein
MTASDDVPAGNRSFTPLATCDVLRVSHGERTAGERRDRLAEETPIALQYNGISHATLLATPADLHDFARGFSLTEGIVSSLSDIRGIDLREETNGISIELEVSSACLFRLKERRRAMAGRTGCGLCGVETLSEVLRPVRPFVRGPAMRIDAILRGMAAMRCRQTLHDATGATHAAAWVNAEGDVLQVREDVGRHNALDKLLGALMLAGIDFTRGAVLVSSRASFEMVQKTAAVGAGVLAAVSAPTALAVRLAEQTGVSLIGFVRGDDCSIYSHAAGVAFEPAPNRLNESTS